MGRDKGDEYSFENPTKTEWEERVKEGKGERQRGDIAYR